MTKYDTLYICPLCGSEHDTDEWNEATEEDFGTGIMPLEIAPGNEEFEYTCPTCSHTSDAKDLRVKE
jgi:RNA polymerase subunit RPABC4/transcription elongation factor Spt4